MTPKTKGLTFFLATLVFFLGAANPIVAQEIPGYSSPEVVQSRVTIRFFAPRARTATLIGEWDLFVKKPMTKNEQGVWSVTTDTLKPDTYLYSVLLDDVQTLDTFAG